MDYAASHVVYVDSRISRSLDGKHLQRATSPPDGTTNNQESSWEEKHPECFKAILGELEEVRTSLKNILTVFNGGKLLFGLFRNNLHSRIRLLTYCSPHLQFWNLMLGQNYQG